MELPKDYNEVQGITGDYEVLEAGGYVCKIINAKEEKSKAGNEMLVLSLDIAEGEHEGYFKRKYDEAKKQNKDVNRQVKWSNNGTHRIMVLDKEGKTNKFFKGFGTIVEESNQGYKWEGKEETLKDKLIGAIFGEEEYEKNDGSIGTTTRISAIRTVHAIKDKKFKVPEIKRLPAKGDSFEEFAKANGLEVNTDEDLPF